MGVRGRRRPGAGGPLDELSLTAVAVGRRHHAARGDRADRGAEVPADDVQGEVDPGAQPGRGHHLPFVDEERRRVDLDLWESRRQLAGPPQWVVARLPSSRPAWASAKAPVQTEITRAPACAASRSASSAACGGGSKSAQ